MSAKKENLKKKYGLAVTRQSDGGLKLGEPILPYCRWLAKPIMFHLMLADIIITTLFAAASPTPFTAALLGSMILLSLIATEYGYRRRSCLVIYIHMVSSIIILLYLLAAVPFLILNPDFTHGTDKKPLFKWFEYWGSPLNPAWAFSFIAYSVLSRLLLLVVSFKIFVFAGMSEALEMAMKDEEVVRKMRKPHDDNPYY